MIEGREVIGDRVGEFRGERVRERVDYDKVTDRIIG